MTVQRILPGIGNNADASIHAKNGVTPHKKDKRRRVQFRFWMDANKPGEAALGEALDALKPKRQFAGFIRDAIRLMFALIAGDWSVLAELFPDVVAAIEAQAPRPDQTLLDMQRDIIQQQQSEIEALRGQVNQERPASADFEALLIDIADHLDNRLDSLQQAVKPPERADMAVNSSAAPQAGATIAMHPVAGGPVQMSVPQFAAPNFDDDDDDILIEVAVDQDAGRRASANFISSIMRLQA